MICASIVTDPNGVQYISPVASQPADMSSCAVVVLVGSDVGALATWGMPSSADAGQAWAIGFGLVVSSYVLGNAIGSVLNFIRTR